MEQLQIKDIFTIIQTQTQNQTWAKKQDPKFIKALTNIENLIQNLSGQVYYFIDLFDQYAAAMSKSPIFQDGTSPLDSQNGEDFPTQTFSEPAPAEAEVAQ